MTDAPMFTGALAFLSNFDETPFYSPELGAFVCSGEHAFNALKTTDQHDRGRILAASTPGLSKRAGRRVTLRPGWDTGVRVWAMRRVIVAKFALPDLRARLVQTGTLHLVETNTWHDQFWGSCTCPVHATATGVNMLGELLMGLRAGIVLASSSGIIVDESATS